MISRFFKELIKFYVDRLMNWLRVKKLKLEAIHKENIEISKRNTRIQVIQEQTQEFLTQLGDATKRLNQHADLDANLEILKNH